MAVMTKAFLKNDVSFEEIAAFLKRTEGDVDLNHYSGKSESVWFVFSDRNGTERNVAANRYTRDLELFYRWAEQHYPAVNKWAGEDGFIVISIGANAEGTRIAEAIAERFGGWLQPDDFCQEFHHIPKKDLSAEERYIEGVELWKAAAKELSDAIDVFIRKTEPVDTAVIADANKALGGWKPERETIKKLACATKILNEKENKYGSFGYHQKQHII